jgi:hypothetical protein
VLAFRLARDSFIGLWASTSWSEKHFAFRRGLAGFSLAGLGLRTSFNGLRAAGFASGFQTPELSAVNEDCEVYKLPSNFRIFSSSKPQRHGDTQNGDVLDCVFVAQ